MPTGSWSANNRAFGLLFVHGNLFGRGKQLLLGGRIADVDSGAALGYRDPSFFGSWIYWQVQGNIQRQDIPEYYPGDRKAEAGPYRSTLLVSYATELTLGVAWWRRVRTQVAWRLEQSNLDRSYIPNEAMNDPTTTSSTLSATTGVGKASLNLDFRAREFSVMTGTVLGGGIDVGRPDFGGDLRFWRVGGGVQHGVKFFKSHNLVVDAGGTFGKDMPFWMENTGGGPNLRGYLYQQFRGDTQIGAGAEYHFPLFSISSLDFRALAFYDFQAVWFRDVPTGTPVNGYLDTRHARSANISGGCQRLPAGGRIRPHPRRPPVGGRRAALLPAFGRGAADRVRRRLGDRVPQLAVHAGRRRLKPASRGRRSLIACAVGLGLALASAPALAAGEEITDVRIMGNTRTEESTVRSVAGVSIGDTLETGTLDMVRERLNTMGLFSDVNVWWEQYKTGVRVNIAVKDKFPWAPVPTGSWSANNKSFGLLFVHGNLFGRGKQLLLGGRIANVDSGAALAYRDPSLFGSWIYWQLQGNIQRQNLPEYWPQGPGSAAGVEGPFRVTLLTSYGVEPTIGVAWWRRMRTQVAWRLEQFTYEHSLDPMMMDQPTMAATQGAKVGIGKASVSFDFRAREFAVMTGTTLGGGVEIARPDFGSDLTFWRAGGGVEHGVRFFKTHNLVVSAGATFGKNLPFWMENTAGGPNLRGYLYQQFRGDSQLAGHAEYHLPLFSIGSLDFRGLAFYDVQALWFRDIPSGPGMYVTRQTPDQRTFLVDANGYPPGGGFQRDRDLHQAIGGGIRFFLRSVSIPLIGFDAGWGLESRTWRFTLIVGA